MASYDGATESKLDSWVAAKRDKDFAKADEIRSELRAMGIEPDIARPSDKAIAHIQGPGGNSAWNAEMESLLDRWVIAKRAKEFSTADAIREELRGHGIDPDVARPSDKQTGQIPASSWGYQSAAAGFGAVGGFGGSSSSGGYGFGGCGWAGGGLHGQVPGTMGARKKVSPEQNVRLDEWVVAKRDKDFARADEIRAELRAEGLEPDVLRPPGCSIGGGAAALAAASAQGAGGGWTGQGGDGVVGGYPGQRFDEPTEAKLEQWVRAKRDKDWSTADSLRIELRAMGIEPDVVRPPDLEKHMANAEVEDKLDRWVIAKRSKDFALADSIRQELRDMGIDPDTARPSDKEFSQQQMQQQQIQMHFQQMQQQMQMQMQMQQQLRASPRGGFGSAAPAAQSKFDSYVEMQLDMWQKAKRDKEFGTADAIRNELRKKGIDPEIVRPPGSAPPSSPVKHMGGGMLGGGMGGGSNLPAAFAQQGYGHDRETESMLDRWVAAKREKDFATADSLRVSLRSKGIDPDTARPAGREMQERGGGYASMGGAFGYGNGYGAGGCGGGWGGYGGGAAGGQANIESQLDRWVEAKRAKDFKTADSIRQVLRSQGVDPDTARPADQPDQVTKRQRGYY